MVNNPTTILVSAGNYKYNMEYNPRRVGERRDVDSGEFKLRDRCARVIGRGAGGKLSPVSLGIVKI